MAMRELLRHKTKYSITTGGTTEITVTVEADGAFDDARLRKVRGGFKESVERIALFFHEAVTAAQSGALGPTSAREIASEPADEGTRRARLQRYPFRRALNVSGGFIVRYEGVALCRLTSNPGNTFVRTLLQTGGIPRALELADCRLLAGREPVKRGGLFARQPDGPPEEIISTTVPIAFDQNGNYQLKGGKRVKPELHLTVQLISTRRGASVSRGDFARKTMDHAIALRRGFNNNDPMWSSPKYGDYKYETRFEGRGKGGKVTVVAQVRVRCVARDQSWVDAVCDTALASLAYMPTQLKL